MQAAFKADIQIPLALTEYYQSHDPGFASYCDSVASYYCNYLQTNFPLPIYILSLDQLPMIPLRDKIIEKIEAEMVTGGRGSPVSLLNTVLSCYKANIESITLARLAHGLLAYTPLGVDFVDRLVTNPCDNLCWNAVERLADLPEWPRSVRGEVLQAIEEIRGGIRDKSLPISQFLAIRDYTDEKRTALVRLMLVDHLNDDQNTVEAAVIDALKPLNDILMEIERIRWVLEKYEIEGEERERAELFCGGVGGVRMGEFRVPTEMQEIRELVICEEAKEQAENIVGWVKDLLYVEDIPAATIESLVFPVHLSEFLYSFSTRLNPLSSSSLHGPVFSALLLVSFPEILLHLELSQSLSLTEKDQWLALWHQQHSTRFTSWLTSSCYRLDRDWSLAVIFTRDTSDFQILIPSLPTVHERCHNFRSGGELRESLKEFRRNDSQKVYILEMDRLIGGNRIDIGEIQRTLEEGEREVRNRGKLVCLVVRVGRGTGGRVVTGRWGKCWTVMAFERLEQSFGESEAGVRQWVRRDGKTVIRSWTSCDFSDRIRSILRVIYSQLPIDPMRKETTMERVAACKVLTDRLLQRLLSILDYSKLSDWKHYVLSIPHLSSEPSLLAAVDTAFDTQAAHLLQPLIATVEHYNAFPSYFEADSIPILRTYWLETFDSLTEGDFRQVGASSPSTALLYPFVYKDYENFFIASELTIGDALTHLELSYRQISITALHTRNREPHKEALVCYIEDLARLELRESPVCREGVLVYLVVCREMGGVQEVVREIWKYRRQIASLCAPMNTLEKKSLQRQTLSKMTAMLQKPNPALMPTKPEVLQMLEDFEEELANCDLSRNPLQLYALKGGNLRVFNCVNKNSLEIVLKSPLSVRQSSFVWLNVDSVFCCGGEEKSLFNGNNSAQVWRISFSGEVTELHPMYKKRKAHGLVRLKNFIYAIGGDDGSKPLRGCEKFRITDQFVTDENPWTELLSYLKIGRHSFSPCLWRGKIYLCGGASACVEVIDPDSDLISQLNVALPHIELTSVAVTVRDSIVLFDKSTRCEINLATETVAEIAHRAYPKPAVCVCEPVCRYEEVYWVDVEGRVTWVELAAGECVGSRQ